MNHDPRITAYATGELEGRERETFEEKLAASDGLHREVQSMSSLAKQLALAAKPTDRFTADERARLLTKCADTRRSRSVAKKSLKVFLWTTVGVAACLVVFVGFVGLVAMNSGSGPWCNDAFSPARENQASGAQAAAAAPATESWSYKVPQSESSPQKQLLSETPAVTAQEATADSATPSDTTPILANDNTRITAFAPAPRIRRPLCKADSSRPC